MEKIQVPRNILSTNLGYLNFNHAKNIYGPFIVASLSFVLFGLLLGGCASTFKKPHLIKDKEPIYIQTTSKDAYHFSLLVTRQIYKHQTSTTNSLTDAKTLVKLNGPTCKRFVIFTDSLGQRRDHLIKCQLDYEVQSLPKLDESSGESKVSSTLLATSLLTRTESLSGYFRKEAEIENELYEDLAKQLVVALATISF